MLSHFAAILLTCVGHIDMLKVRTELNAVRRYEVVGYSLYNAGGRLETIDLRADGRCWSEISVAKPVSLFANLLGWITLTYCQYPYLASVNQRSPV